MVPDPPSLTRPAGRSVVIAEDSPAMRTALAVLLERTEFTVIGSVGDGLRALELVVRRQPDVLLLDLDMPRLSGVQIIADVRRLSPATRVVIVSGYLADDLTRLCAEAGAHAYVVKHDLRATLVPALRRVLSREGPPPPG